MPRPLCPAVVSDPRIELLAAVQLLADARERFQGFHPHDVPYVRKAKRWFAPWRSHPAVECYRRASLSGLDYLQAYNFMLALGEPPELRPPRPIPAEIASGAGGPGRIEELRRQLADFARVSDFAGFYRSAAVRLGSMIRGLEAQIRASTALRAFRRYTGLSPESLPEIVWILSPCAERNIAVTRYDDLPDGRVRVTGLLGPNTARGGRLNFRFDRRLSDLWHELALHPLLAAAGAFRGRLEASSSLFDPIRENCYGSWLQCAHQQIAWAVSGRLLAGADREASEEFPGKFARMGMPYVGPLMERLREYERSRRRYRSLTEFYPRLLDAYDELASRPGAPVCFGGNLAALKSARAPVWIILPGARRPAKRLRDRLGRLWPGARVVSDAEALGADLADKTLVAVGTPRENLWLRRNWASLNLPIRPGRARIAVAREDDGAPARFSGPLRFLSVALNPADRRFGALLYSGDPGTLPAAVDRHMGPWDFVILRGEEVLKSGLYERSLLPWRVV